MFITSRPSPPPIELRGLFSFFRTLFPQKTISPIACLKRAQSLGNALVPQSYHIPGGFLGGKYHWESHLRNVLWYADLLCVGALFNPVNHTRRGIEGLVTLTGAAFLSVMVHIAVTPLTSLGHKAQRRAVLV